MGLIGALEKGIAVFFLWLGDFLGRNPLKVIAGVIVLTIVMSLGLINFEEVNNVRTEYSPINAPSRREYEVAKSFLGQNGTMDPAYMLIQARDGGSLLRDKYRDLILNLTKTLQKNVSVEHKGRIYGYTTLCEPYCEMNTAFLAFLKLYDINEPSTYTYPSLEFYGTHAFIGNNVFGVKLKEGTRYIESFSTAIEPFFVVGPEHEQALLLKWIRAAQAEYNKDEWHLLKVGMTGDLLVSAEVRRMGFETAPLIVGSVVAMIVFVVCGSFRQNPARSKPWESLVGCIVPLIALLASTGIILAFGLKFQAIVVASLFLVLSVGVDDVFLILRAWDHTDVNRPVNERLSKTLEDAGPSITISSLTDAMSFAIGIASQTPAVRTFSIYSCIAIIICYFYQLILFSAVLALSGKREQKGYQSLLCCLKADPQAHNRSVEYVTGFQDWIIKMWCHVITRWNTRFFLVIVLLVYYYISLVGIQNLRSDISIDKMALPDSYLHDFQYTYETALRDMMPISIFIMNPGDLRDPARIKRIKTMINEFEHCIYSYGNESTFFWLEQYEDFLSAFSETSDFTYEEIPTFFKSTTYFFLSSFVKMNESACNDNDPACISAFFVLTNFHKVVKYHEMIPAVLEWRQLAAKYSDLDVYAYSDHSPFVDQTLTIESTALWSVVCALFCTATACFFFIPNLVCILCAIFSVLSICIGIFGVLSHWGVDLDPLSTAALLMAIGLSVDFTAHVTYHYYRAKGRNSEERLEEALTRIGWPMTQVGLSTIVALLPLLFKQSYLALVFIKTVVVVVTIGMLHGLIVMPAVLTSFVPDRPASGKSSAESSERSSQRSNERDDSFYNSQKLISKSNKVSADDRKKRKTKEANIVAPISPLDLISKGPVAAYVHKIELGRTASAKYPGS